MKNYYQILQVKPSASIDDIKRSYRSLALRFHPDINSSENANEVFSQISEAYETLSDPQKRNVYDAKMIYGSASSAGLKSDAYYKKYGTNKKYPNKKPIVNEIKEVRFEKLEKGAYYFFLFLGLFAFVNSVYAVFTEEFSSHVLNGLIFSVLFTFLLFYSWNKFYKK